MNIDLLLSYELFGFSVVRWSMIILFVLLTTLVLSSIKRFVLERLVALSEEHEDIEWLNYIEAMFGRSKLFLYLAVGLFVALTVFDVSPPYALKGQAVVQVFVIIQLGIWISAGASVVLERLKTEVEDDPAQLTALSAINFLIGLVIWSIVALLVLANLGFDITALIASLGIGGIAIALAAQKILGDLFAFFSIIVDKPFLKSDFIVVGDIAGTIEHIGIKTTRLRSLNGEQVIFSNEDLLQSRIRNFKRMKNRRVVLEFGVSYKTAGDDIDAIPTLVEQVFEDLVEAGLPADFDRAHLHDFGASSLRFEVVYAVLSSDFSIHMDIRQAFLSKLLATLRDRDIDVAIPAQTIHLENTTQEVTMAA